MIIDTDKMHWPIDLKDLLDELEADLISIAISESSNNTQAAKLLGIERTTLVEKRRMYGFPLAPPDRNRSYE